ncbi:MULTISPECIES: polyprenyl diphosphate synthase [unclassified Thioalkalivibrio]|uniref:polyprenyl diphosphate synthase n=1 Tax=unclassified Thioalkalivibrio TaxID=2621013 RepID=UPI00035CC14F|nr:MULTISPECIES: polyprenyl diphosphate synthase [unclassified Thioalkalivibrio]
MPVTSATDPALPGHVAVIMDGNGRWAQARGLDRSAGHREGLEATRRAVRYYAEHGVHTLTLFAFSSENWGRPRAEVEALFELFVSAIEAELPELVERGIRLRFIGDRATFPPTLQGRMDEAEVATAGNDGMCLVVALGYGGRWDILQAARRWAAKGGSEHDGNAEAAFAAELSTAGLSDVDLLIRTGGEQRISNFLLWQAAYAEVLFLETYWPDVGEKDFERSLAWYARRQRRFGCVPAGKPSASEVPGA